MPKEKITKKQIIEKIFQHCCRTGDFVFDNDLVKKILVDNHSSTNPYDMTKIDSKEKLPEVLVENDYAILHLGSGRHKFIKGINKIYHDFEPVQQTIQWEYRKSVLNLFNSNA